MNTRVRIVFLDESGASPLPQVRRTCAPRGRAPLLRHRPNRKRASMAGALGHHAAGPDRGPRLCLRLKPGSYDTAGLIEVLGQMKVFHHGERVVLVREGPWAHRSRPMPAWVGQDRLALERSPAHAPAPNPVEPLWSPLKKSELADLAGDHLADVADATERGIHRIDTDPRPALRLPRPHRAHPPPTRSPEPMKRSARRTTRTGGCGCRSSGDGDRRPGPRRAPVRWRPPSRVSRAWIRREFRLNSAVGPSGRARFCKARGPGPRRCCVRLTGGRCSRGASGRQAERRAPHGGGRTPDRVGHTSLTANAANGEHA
ncbi:transposase [Streptomyces griseus]|uniref:transposase n=1 Tax=Streptomyces griseus TaxID=1911 RepID=UPI001F181B9B|nr:transposase [Streptomyces griseus]